VIFSILMRWDPTFGIYCTSAFLYLSCNWKSCHHSERNMRGMRQPHSCNLLQVFCCLTQTLAVRTRHMLFSRSQPLVNFLVEHSDIRVPGITKSDDSFAIFIWVFWPFLTSLLTSLFNERTVAANSKIESSKKYWSKFTVLDVIYFYWLKFDCFLKQVRLPTNKLFRFF
jgi:hypothetical protein